ncbi:MAG TPA: cation diffusion facilitator family transporter [Anaeromyxobacteraceae bacterium]|nr:cation diffusion facilitator family transporter [Anaeromyxobacteraceae bacterium]
MGASHHHHHPHGHAHGPGDAGHAGAAATGRADASSARRLALSLGVASGILVAEAVGGWLSGSLALLSDAGHMLTDVAALALALLAVVFAARPADDKRTFGFRRLEVLAAQVNVAALVLLTGWIAWEAIDRLRHPHPPVAIPLMAGTALVGILGNLLVLGWLRHDHSVNARSAFLHVLGDFVSSGVVLAAAAVMWFEPSWTWVDPILSLGIGLLILWGALRLSLEIADILMEAVPRHLDLGQVCREMEATEGVLAVHDVHIWTISSGLYALSAHLVVRPGEVGHNDAILTAVKGRLRASFAIDHTTLQIESADYAHLYEHVHDNGPGRRAAL